MLDECKGEKFEDVLRIFGLAVLRREAGKRFKNQAGFAEALATRSSSGALDERALVALLLAHDSRLRGNIRGRRELEGRFRAQEASLEESEAALQRRRDEAEVSADSIPVLKIGDLEHYEELLMASWTANVNWIQAIVHEGSKSKQPMLPPTSEEVSSPIEARSPAELLMTNINEKLAQQQVRLREWKALRDTFPEPRVVDENAETARVPLLRFEAHCSLIPGDMDLSSSQENFDHAEIPALIKEMREELAGLGKFKTPMAIEPQHVSEVDNIHHELPSSLATLVSDRDHDCAQHSKKSEIGGPSANASLESSLLEELAENFSSPPPISTPVREPHIAKEDPAIPPISDNVAETTLAERTRLSIALLPPFGAVNKSDAHVSKAEAAKRPQSEDKARARRDTMDQEKERGAFQPEQPVTANGSVTRSKMDTHSEVPPPPDMSKLNPRTPSPKRTLRGATENKFAETSTSPDLPRRNTPSTLSKRTPRPVLRPRTPAPSVDIDLNTADYASVFKSRPRVAVSPPPLPSPTRSNGDIVHGTDDEAPGTDTDVYGESFNSQSSPIRGWR